MLGAPLMQGFVTAGFVVGGRISIALGGPLCLCRGRSWWVLLGACLGAHAPTLGEARLMRFSCSSAVAVARRGGQLKLQSHWTALFQSPLQGFLPSFSHIDPSFTFHISVVTVGSPVSSGPWQKQLARKQQCAKTHRRCRRRRLGAAHGQHRALVDALLRQTISKNLQTLFRSHVPAADGPERWERCRRGPRARQRALWQA